MTTIAEAFAIARQQHQAGQLPAAEQIYRQILKADPNHAEAWHLLGVIAHQIGRNDVATQYIERAIQLRPDLAEAHNNLGNVLTTVGDLPAAINAYQQALAVRADFPEAHNNLGNVWKSQGRLPDAIAAFQQAIALKPDFAVAHNNLGIAWKDQGELDKAVDCYQQALQLQPNYAEALNNLGNACKVQGKLEAAVAAYRQALQAKPDFIAALGSLVQQLQQICDWEDWQSLTQRVIDAVENPPVPTSAGQIAPFAFITLPTPTTAAQQLRCASQWVKRQAGGTLARNDSRQDKIPGKLPLTIGYLSADFHSHPTAWLIAELLEQHNREQVRVHGYSYGPDDGSAIRQRLIRAFDKFVDLRELSHFAAAQQIAHDEVDILVDLKGYTYFARPQIAALRPAPIQVNYLGYPGTMGADFVDYILVDDFVVPSSEQPYFTEKLVHLPGCYQVNDSRREVSPHTPTRGECGLPASGMVFCCFNHNYKITPDVFRSWMRILHAVPGSTLWLLEGNRLAPANLRKEAAKSGISDERLVFARFLPSAEHLARYRLADLFLDTFPVNAHTTASDALWLGCPVLTIAGETFVSRVAGSLLRAVGMPEFITTSLAEYEALAVRLGQNADQLRALREKLAACRGRATVFDAARFAGNLERAYRTMWELYAAGEKPRPFTVEPC